MYRCPCPPSCVPPQILYLRIAGQLVFHFSMNAILFRKTFELINILFPNCFPNLRLSLQSGRSETRGQRCIGCIIFISDVIYQPVLCSFCYTITVPLLYDHSSTVPCSFDHDSDHFPSVYAHWFTNSRDSYQYPSKTILARAEFHSSLLCRSRCRSLSLSICTHTGLSTVEIHITLRR